ncbi:ATP-binding protein [Nocardioides zeae]|uniref:ATP-binding protein n=1 Tax=Nocardioides zeae TaxID=1457234 RepID=A0A6P0HQJ9_9ACTN|nr:ATP-binding protein [Nocardioides zeae]NEN80424.1 ATP-binding protein [Nocardioides zeae]
MPQSREAVRLEPGPTCVQQARRWAAAVCRDMGREDLLDAAELGVSELVTNALLHASEPITVRVRGTQAHPRFEVSDGSRVPPSLSVAEPEPDLGDDDEFGFLLTVGRGLGLVAMNSAAWGADIVPEGKVVWFEPVPEPRLDADLEGEVFDITLTTGDIERVPTVFVRLRGMPLLPYRDFRRHYGDLRREVRLLSLAHQDDYPLAHELSRVFDLFENHIDHAGIAGSVDAGLAAGRSTGDFLLTVGQPAADLSHQMRDLLDLADAFCRTQRLLSLARSEQQRDFQRWLLGEISAQAAGEAPTPWVEPRGESWHAS